jgi:hypothetical protein
MREVFTTLESILAPLNSFDKAVFLVKVMCHKILHKLIGLAPLLGRSFCEPGFEIGVEIDFHTLQDAEKSVCEQV